MSLYLFVIIRLFRMLQEGSMLYAINSFSNFKSDVKG